MYSDSNNKVTLGILETKRGIRTVRVVVKCPH